MIAGRPPLSAAGRALRHRNFRLFFYGELVSITGSWIQYTAQAWLVVTLVGNMSAAFYLGLLGAVQVLPVLVLGLFGGIIADVLPKRRTVIVTQTAAGLLALIMGLLVFLGVVQVWHVFVVGFALGIVNAVDMPSRQAFVVEIVISVAFMQVARNAGLRFPADISLVGFDDIDLASLVMPAVTTLAVDKVLMGRAAFALLTHRLEVPTAEPAKAVVLPRLIERESVAPPHSR